MKENGMKKTVNGSEQRKNSTQNIDKRQIDHWDYNLQLTICFFVFTSVFIVFSWFRSTWIFYVRLISFLFLKYLAWSWVVLFWFQNVCVCVFLWVLCCILLVCNHVNCVLSLYFGSVFGIFVLFSIRFSLGMYSILICYVKTHYIYTDDLYTVSVVLFFIQLKL